MLTNLMNYIFVFSIGILIGGLFAFEVFQKQLEKTIKWERFKRMPLDWCFLQYHEKEEFKK